MKTTLTILFAAVLAVGTVFAQTNGVAPPPAVVAATNGPVQPPPAAPATVAAAPTNAPSPAAPAGGNPDALRLNFRGVPLDMVLNYLSDAAGFIIVLETPVHGTVDVWSDRPVTRDEAVDLLNSVLNKNGYAAIRDGRTLIIMSKSDAKSHDIPVKIGSNPSQIPKNDEMVTQIIPVHYVDAKQLATDLSPFVSPQATIVANQSANSIVITDTQSNIRHLAQIIEAIDNSSQGETEIRVFALRYANPNDIANELGQIFPSATTGGNQPQLPFRFGGPGGFLARMAAAQAATGAQNPAVQKQTQVVAVADPRTQSVIVTASKDLMEQISGMIEQLDVPSGRDQKTFVFHLNNGDPQQALQVLQNLFPSTGTTTGRGGAASSTQNSALQEREVQNATTIGSGTSTTGFGGSNTRGRTGAGRTF